MQRLVLLLKIPPTFVHISLSLLILVQRWVNDGWAAELLLLAVAQAILGWSLVQGKVYLAHESLILVGKSLRLEVARVVSLGEWMLRLREGGRERCLDDSVLNRCEGFSSGCVYWTGRPSWWIVWHVTNLNFKLLIMEHTLSFEPLPDLEVIIKAKIDKFLQ